MTRLNYETMAAGSGGRGGDDGRYWLAATSNKRRQHRPPESCGNANGQQKWWAAPWVSKPCTPAMPLGERVEDF